MNEHEEFPHLNAAGEVHMVSVTGKDDTVRKAKAQGRILAPAVVVDAVRRGVTKKGDVLAVARVAGIMAAKRTAEWIPLCHPIALTGISVIIEFDDEGFVVTAETETRASTGVEMEAMTAVSAALLTLYDMLKAQHRGLVLTEIHLVEKTGGKNEDYQADHFPPHRDPHQ